MAPFARATSEGPPRPPAVDYDDVPRALRWSLIVHGIALAAIVIKSVVFPGKPVAYVPTLRVDMVGLPDMLKKDMANLPKPGGTDEIAEALKRAEEAARKVKPVPPPKAKTPIEQADPDELVLKDKKKQQELAQKQKEREEKEDREREKKLKNSLARIKALSKIQDAEKSDRNAGPAGPAKGTLIKGNAISHGTSTSGEARESSEASYFDSIRDRLQENWALPVWIARQRLSAQVQLYIDARGMVKNFKIVKSSGNPQFDEAVKRTVAQSQPFAAPPSNLAGSVLVHGILVGFPL